jgi:hypothetical protein
MTALLFPCVLLLAQVDATANTDELRASVNKLVQQMDAPALADREAAEKDLLALGPKILELLPPENPRMRAEQKLRLTRVREGLQKTLVEAFTKPTSVTLDVKDTPVSEVLAELEKQTGNKTTDYRPQFGQPSDDPKISVSFKETSYWEALDTVLDAANLTVYSYAGGNELPIVAPMDTDVPRRKLATYDGPFRFEPVYTEARRDYRKADGGVLKLHLELSWEPRLTPVLMTIPVASLQAKDERGNALSPQDTQPEYEIPVQPETSVAELEFALNPPERDVRQIASVEAEVTMLILGQKHVFEFDELREQLKAERRFGPVTVFVDDIRKFDEGIWRVFLRASYDEASGALQSHLGWVLRNEAAMVDSRGNRVVSQDYELTSQGQSEVGIAYFFALEGNLEDHTLTYTSPAAVIRQPVKIRVGELNLP